VKREAIGLIDDCSILIRPRHSDTRVKVPPQNNLRGMVEFVVHANGNCDVSGVHSLEEYRRAARVAPMMSRLQQR
jgi:hypothetical protein